jgi:spermidine synthase
MKKINRSILWVVITTGISSVVLQLISIRELLARFQGNEFVIALILFNWLTLGGVGTFLAKWTARSIFRPGVNRLIWLSLLLTFLSVIQVVAIRKAYDLVFIHGSSVGFYPTFLYILLTLAPYGLLLGFVLPYSLFVIKSRSPEFSGARIYIIDNLGDVTGGALFSFALVFLVSPFTAVCLANMPLIAACFLLTARSDLPKQRFYLAGLLAACVLLSGIFLEKSTLIHAEGELIHYRESRYGRIEILQQHEMRTLLLDGVPLFTSQNRHMAEEIIHFPLAQVHEPQHVLILSGEGGIMQELEKYHPETTDYVELDTEITKAGLQFGLIKKIRGLRIIHQDGRAHLTRSTKKYDAIILNLPEPDTFQLNRFFTAEFYRLVKYHLDSGGVFSFAMQGYGNYLPETQQKKLSIIYSTVRQYFKHVLLLPGQRIYFLCSQDPITADIPTALEKKGIATLYINAYYNGDLSRKRIEDLNRLIDPGTSVNQDYRPRIMRMMFSQWFKKFSTSPLAFIVVILLLAFLYLIAIPKESYVLFTTGFTNMGCEILVIFAFQILYGYIYYQIGLIVTVFLAGLLPGAFFAQHLGLQNRRWLKISDSLLTLLVGCFILGLQIGGERLPVLFFMLFGFIVSVVSGFQFPIALQLQGGGKSAIAQSFSADLIGAAFGILITSIFLMPYGGIQMAAIVLVGVKMSSFLLNHYADR